MTTRLLTALVLVAAPALADELVAVLPLDVTNARMSDGDRAALEEGLRTAAGAELQPMGYTVLTGETTLAVLGDNGIDVQRACEASCALDAARELKARIFLSGSVATSEGRHVANLRLFEVNTGKMLATTEIEGDTIRALRQQFKDEARSFFTRGLGPSSIVDGTFVEGRIGPSGRTGGTAKADVIVRFETDPPGAIVIVDGSIVCDATPCSRQQPAGIHEVQLQKEEHDPWVGKATFEKGATVSERLTPAFALVRVATEPPGLAVRIDGKSAGNAPIEQRLAPGGHEIVIDDRCHEQTGERLNLAKGESRELTLPATARASAVRVASEDRKGNALEADVYVDGERVGTSPGTFKVPLCSRKLEVKSGALSWRANLSLRERETEALAARLEPLEPEPELTGNLRVDLDGVGTWAADDFDLTLSNGLVTRNCRFQATREAMRQAELGQLDSIKADPRRRCTFDALAPGRWRLEVDGTSTLERTFLLKSPVSLRLEGGVYPYPQYVLARVPLGFLGLLAGGLWLSATSNYMPPREFDLNVSAMMLNIVGGLVGGVMGLTMLIVLAVQPEQNRSLELTDPLGGAFGDPIRQFPSQHFRVRAGFGWALAQAAIEYAIFDVLWAGFEAGMDAYGFSLIVGAQRGRLGPFLSLRRMWPIGHPEASHYDSVGGGLELPFAKVWSIRLGVAAWQTALADTGEYSTDAWGMVWPEVTIAREF